MQLTIRGPAAVQASPHSGDALQLRTEQHTDMSHCISASYTLLPVSTPAFYISSCSHIQHDGFFL